MSVRPAPRNLRLAKNPEADRSWDRPWSPINRFAISLSNNKCQPLIGGRASLTQSLFQSQISPNFKNIFFSKIPKDLTATAPF